MDRDLKFEVLGTSSRAFPAGLARLAWRKDRRLQQKRSSIMWLGLIHDKPVREGLVRVETS